MIIRIASLLILLTLTACGLPSNVVVLVPDESGSVGKAVVSNDGQEAALDAPFAAVEAKPGQTPGKVVVATKERVDREFADALAATPRAPTIFRVYFASGSADLDADAHSALDAAATAAKALPHFDIGVVGYTDATAQSGDANMALSLRRAEIVRDALAAAGIPPDMMDIAYYGANNPVVPNKLGVPERLNRRVEITIR